MCVGQLRAALAVTYWNTLPFLVRYTVTIAASLLLSAGSTGLWNESWDVNTSNIRS